MKPSTMSIFTDMRLMTPIALAALLLVSGCIDTPDKSNAQEEVTSPALFDTTLKKGQIEQHRISRKGNHPYTVYLPVSFDTLHRFAVTVLLDPQGDANRVVEKYAAIADNHHRILVCSEDFKNGKDPEQCKAIVSCLIEEAVYFLRADPSAVNLMGFSGGSRAAILAASQLSGISSLTYCGAAPPPGSTPLRIPSLGIAGIRDMNFTEVLYFTSSLDTTTSRPTMLVTADRHEWPDTSTFRLISGWAGTVACRYSQVCDSSVLINTANLTSNLISKQKDPILRDLLLRFMVSTFDGFVPLDKEKKEMESNLRSTSFSKALEVFRSSIQFETSVRQEFAEAFKVKDMPWWESRIDDLRKNQSDPVSDRLLGHLSLAAFTYSRLSIDRSNSQDADYFLRLYETVDPENPEWAFLRACLSEQSGDRNASVKSLEQANRMGLKDSGKIKQEKWLQQAVQDPRVATILQRMDQTN